MPKPESKSKKKWERIWKKINDNRKIYLHTLKIVILRNKGLIFALCVQISLLIYTIILLTTDRIEILAAQKYTCNIPNSSKTTTINNSNSNSNSNNSQTHSCSNTEIGNLRFMYRKAFLDMTYFYSEFSPYNNPELTNDSLEDIKKLEKGNIKQNTNTNFPYSKSEVKEKYVLIFPFSRCFEEIAVFGQSTKTSSGGCDLNVIGSLLYVGTIFLLFSVCLVIIGLYLYSRSLFLWSPKHKFTLAFSFTSLFMLVLNVVFLFMFTNEVTYNIGTFSTIFNGFMITRIPFTFLKAGWIEWTMIFTILQVITVYITMGIYTNMTPEKKKYRDNYEFLMNQRRYQEEVSSVTESTDGKLNEIY